VLVRFKTGQKNSSAIQKKTDLTYPNIILSRSTCGHIKSKKIFIPINIVNKLHVSISFVLKAKKSQVMTDAFQNRLFVIKP